MKIRFVKPVAMIAMMVTGQANADVLYQFTTQDAAYAQVGQYNVDGQVGVNFYVEGAGATATATAHLSYFVWIPGAGFESWNGTIPADAVQINGVSSATIFIDTCTLIATGYASANSCGVVDLVVNKDPLAFGWTYGGASVTTYGDVVNQTSGSWSWHKGDATGSVMGLTINTDGDAYAANRTGIGRYNNVQVAVSTS